MNCRGSLATRRRLRSALACTLFLASGLLVAHAPESAAGAASPEIRIAIIGDQGLTADARAVLQLIVDEGADAVLHNGDFDYQDDPAAWEAQINDFLGPDFPYFASIGNHDESRYYGSGGYQEFLEARMNRLGIVWDGDLGVQSSFEWRGIFFVLTGAGVLGAGDGFHDVYIRDQLAASDSIWRVSGWHENMRLMQVGTKGDSTGWGVYEESRRGGAIIANGHSHTYSRSHLLSSTELQVVADTSNDFTLSADDPSTPEDEGRSFVTVSGIAGRGIRVQELSGPWWASIYTADQDAEPGALFGVFNAGGVANRARFYFKNVLGEVIDEFFVTSAANAPLEPTILSEEIEVSEGDAGSQPADVHVVLMSPDGNEVSVDYATSDDGATAGEDYEATAGRLVFLPGETEHVIQVRVHGDTLEEGDERVSMDFSNPLNAALPYASSGITILDDDLAARVTLTVNAGPGGSVVLDPPGGIYAPGTEVTLTAVPAAGFFFSGWSGALGGTANPDTLVLDADRGVGASFTALPPELHEVRSGGSTDANSVTTADPVAAAAGHLYLAAVATKPHAEVNGVSGLGLDWSPVREQCAARGQTGVSVWQARGVPTGDGTVVATFSSNPRNAVISVSRYGAASSPRVSNLASANSVGQPGACSGGSDGTTYAFDLGVQSVNSAIYLAVAMRFRDHLPPAGFVEQTEIYQGSLAGNRVGLSVAEGSAAPPSLTLAGAFDGSVDWAAIALEIDSPRFYSLTLQAGAGGVAAADPVQAQYAEGSAVTLTATPDPGFVFAGWGGDVPTGEGNPATLVMDDHKLVIPLFEPGYRVTVAPTFGGSVALSPPPSGLVPSGTAVTLTATPWSHRIFGEWTGDVPPQSGNPTTLVVDEDKQVGAIFLYVVDLQVMPTNGGSIELDPATGPYLGASRVTVTAEPDPGFAFTGWTGDLAGRDNPASLWMIDDMIVGATFAGEFDVTVEPPSGGTIALDPPGGAYLPGTSVTVTATPDPGLLFDTWSGDLPAAAANPAALLVDADKVVGARFVPGFSVTVEPATGGAVTLDPPATGLYPVGTVVTATATPDPGHLFAGWSGDLGGQPHPASITSDAHVVAQFVPAQPELEQTATGGSSESSLVATATPLMAAAGSLYLAAISAKPHTDVTGVSGLGLVWTPVRSQCSGRSQTGLSLWRAQGQPTADGVVTASLADAPRNAVIAVSRYSAAAFGGNVVPGNTLGVSGPCSGGQDGTQYAFDLDTAVPNAVAYVAAAIRLRDHAPGPGFVERVEVYQGAFPGDKVGLSIADRPVPAPARVSVTGTTDASVDWAVVTLEIRAPGAQP